MPVPLQLAPRGAGQIEILSAHLFSSSPQLSENDATYPSFAAQVNTMPRRIDRNHKSSKLGWNDFEGSADITLSWD